MGLTVINDERKTSLVTMLSFSVMAQNCTVKSNFGMVDFIDLKNGDCEAPFEEMGFEIL